MIWRIPLRQVIHRGRLDHRAAHYILRHPELLPKMPIPGAQGTYRDFTLRQAMRLGICAHLIKGGVWPPNAGRATVLCEELIRRWPSAAPDHRGRLYASSLRDPWTLRIVNGRYFRLWRNQLTEKADCFDDSEFIDLADGRCTTDFFVLGAIEIDLTYLEGRLSGLDR